MGSYPCSTKCFPITSGQTILPDEYLDCVKQSPPIMTLFLRQNNTILQLYINEKFIANINFTDSSFLQFDKLTDLRHNVTFTKIISDKNFTFNFQFEEDVPDFIGTSNDPDLDRNYVPGDIYSIVKCFGAPKVYAVFTRNPDKKLSGAGNSIITDNPDMINPTIMMNSNTNNVRKCTKNKCSGDNISYCSDNNGCSLLSNCDNVRVPAILINAQINVDGSDLGDANFQICDKFQYYDTEVHNINNLKINYIPIENLKQTKFRESNISIYNVLRGEGRTACEKISNLFTISGLDIDFISFYENIATYAIIRYILSKLLYGDFNMDYLLQKYYQQFLEDLSKSRFWAFLENFLDCNLYIYGYEKYFL